MDEPVSDPLTEVRLRARRALASSWKNSCRVIPWWLGGVAVVVGCVTGLVQAQMLDKGQAWGAVVGFIAAGPLIYGAAEFLRLHERSEALRELASISRQYDVLLTAAWRERDEAKARTAELRQLIAGAGLAKLLAAPVAHEEDDRG